MFSQWVREGGEQQLATFSGWKLNYTEIFGRSILNHVIYYCAHRPKKNDMAKSRSIMAWRWTKAEINLFMANFRRHHNEFPFRFVPHPSLWCGTGRRRWWCVTLHRNCIALGGRWCLLLDGYGWNGDGADGGKASPMMAGRWWIPGYFRLWITTWKIYATIGVTVK